MLPVGEPRFIRNAHRGVAKGVSFSPRDRYQLCSGGHDGKLNIFDPLTTSPLITYQVNNQQAMKNINAVKYSADGSRILCTTSKRLSIVDVETGDLINAYDNCCFPSGPSRSAIAVDPTDPYGAVCSCMNGRGIITFDLRLPEPVRFTLNIHRTTIRDLHYVEPTWPFVLANETTVVSVSTDGICKIRDKDDRELQVFDTKIRANCVTTTQSHFLSTAERDIFNSFMVIGGDKLVGYLPIAAGRQEAQVFDCGTSDKQISRVRFHSSGLFLYVVANDDCHGCVRKYKRSNYQLDLLEEMYSHKDKIIDMDISANEEFLATACQDGSVAVVRLGQPSYGTSGSFHMA